MKVPAPNGLSAELEGIPLVKLVFCINLATDKPLSELGPAAHVAFDIFRKYVPEASIRFYATGTMSKHKPVNKRTLTMLQTWLAPGAKLNDYAYLSYQDSASFNHAPSSLFLVAGREEVKGKRAGDATLIRLSLAPELLPDDPKALVELTTSLWDALPLRSGQAGLALETTPYLKEQSHGHAIGISMRHPGIDIPVAANDGIMIGHDRMRGVGWLTLLDDAFVAKLGGVDALTRAVGGLVTVIHAGHGVVLQAGPRPEPGDVNHGNPLPAYRAVYDAISPLMPQGRVPPLNLDRDWLARTERWVHRFGR